MHLTFGAKLRSFAPQEAARELSAAEIPNMSGRFAVPLQPSFEVGPILSQVLLPRNGTPLAPRKLPDAFGPGPKASCFNKPSSDRPRRCWSTCQH